MLAFAEGGFKGDLLHAQPMPARPVVTSLEPSSREEEQQHLAVALALSLDGDLMCRGARLHPRQPLGYGSDRLLVVLSASDVSLARELHGLVLGLIASLP